MADFLARPAGLGPDGAPPRQTRLAEGGHQIRLTAERNVIRVSCRCQERRLAPWSRPTAGDDHWELYNQLPHDPADGPFTPVDEVTGAPAQLPQGAR